MEKLAKVALDNEMDLILAHKRTMKLAELAGLSLAAQTTFATAVLEVARYAMEQGTKPLLTLAFQATSGRQYLLAVVDDPHLPVANPLSQGLLYAQRLVEKLELTSTSKGSRITLNCSLPASRKITAAHLEQWRLQFSADQPLSHYDEIKRKNEQLQELALRLQDSEQHYRRVTDALPLMIFTANTLGQLLYANAWIATFTGVTLSVLNQTKWAAVLHPEEYAAFWETWDRQTASGQSFRGEWRLKAAEDGDYLWHLFSVQPAGTEPNKVTAWTGFVVNIHAQKIVGQTLQENEELSRAKAELEESQRELVATVRELNRSNAELSQFAYVASHDLQEPLRKIQAFGDLLQRQYADTLGPQGTDLITRMQGAAGRMHGLVKDLLAYSRLTTQQKPFQSLDLNQLMLEVLSDLETVIKENKALLEINPLPVVQGDPLQMRQLFQNLLSNALKFSQPGQPPVIRLTATQIGIKEVPKGVMLAGHAQFVAVSVADNGIGFDEKYTDRIFRLFQRLHGKMQYKGTGIGLAICQKVVANHGGAISVRSQVGQGATFTVYLPAN